MGELPQIISVFGLAFFYFWPSIPAGLAFGLSPLVVIVTSSLSYMCGVALVTVVGGSVRQWILARLEKKTTLNPDSLLGRVWGRFGVMGLGLAAPMTVGSQLGAAIGIALGASPRQLMLWMGIGTLFWSALLTFLVVAGLAAL